MTNDETRKAHQTRRQQFRAAQVLGMQIGDFRAPPDTGAVRKHLYALLGASEVMERGLPGCVLTEYKRCGKARCRCTTGQLHGPYHYWYGRLFGLTWKRYVKRAEAPRVRALCQLRRDRHVSRAKLRAAFRFLKAHWRYLDDALDTSH
jgi:hypothetical protein